MTDSSLSPTLIVLRFGELFLKGANRRFFEQKLIDNVHHALKECEPVALERDQGRLFVDCPRDRTHEALARLQPVFGLSSLSLAFPVKAELQELQTVALSVTQQHLIEAQAHSFKVSTKRSEKRFPLNSMEVNRQVGGWIASQTGLKVDLETPDLEVGIEIGRKRSFVFVDRIPGAGGLPVGTAGLVALLLSGGIDSPVAGYMMQKRGCEIAPIYFHSFPYTGEHTLVKVRRLAKILCTWQRNALFSVVPFTDVQLAVREHCPNDMAVLLYRRMMLRIATKIARAQGCLALVTGDNLGQVASQTLENMSCIQAVAGLAVHRPLLCFDKLETIKLAQKIGTYDISIEPYEDCCSLFVPKHPIIRARPAAIERAEAKLEVEALVDKAVSEAQTIELDADEY